MYRIPLTKPCITSDTKRAVLDVLDSNHLTEGPVTTKLEEAFKTYTKSRFAIAVPNCTLGLELALKSVAIKDYPYVVIPAFTHPATAQAILNTGGQPVFVDIDLKTLNIDYDLLEKAVREYDAKIIMPVSLFGNPLDYHKLYMLKAAQKLTIIEDAACSIGSKYIDIPVGHLADISVFSMHPRKTITSGEGGMITTDIIDVGHDINIYKNFGSNEGGMFWRSGSNYKLSDIQAAIALSQFETIDTILARRIELARYYKTKLKNVKGIFFQEKSNDKDVHSYQSFVIRIDDRDRILKEMRDIGIEVQIGTYFLRSLGFIKNSLEWHSDSDLDNSREASQTTLTLPLYYSMERQEQDEVISTLIKLMRK